MIPSKINPKHIWKILMKYLLLYFLRTNNMMTTSSSKDNNANMRHSVYFWIIFVPFIFRQRAIVMCVHVSCERNFWMLYKFVVLCEVFGLHVFFGLQYLNIISLLWLKNGFNQSKTKQTRKYVFNENSEYSFEFSQK